MLSNSLGANILAGTVTNANFRGPPIVACAVDLVADPFPAAAWANLVLLADDKQFPVIGLDSHNSTADLLAVLAPMLKFFSGHGRSPLLWSEGITTQEIPVCGPILYFEVDVGSSSSPGPARAVAIDVATQTLNFRRNELYGLASLGVWPVLGEDLDRIQRPPILSGRNVIFDDPTVFPYKWATWQNAQGTGTLQQQIAKGLDELALQEVAYPGISRHVFPPNAVDNYNFFLFPWSP